MHKVLNDFDIEEMKKQPREKLDECRFSDDEVLVNKKDEIVMLIPKNSKWNGFLSGLKLFSKDFMADSREDQTEQEREKL